MGTAQSRIDGSDDERDEHLAGPGAAAPGSSSRPAPVAGQRRRRDSHDDQAPAADQDARPSLRRRLLHPIRSSARLHRQSSAPRPSGSAAPAAAGSARAGDAGGPPSEDTPQEGGDATRRLADALGVALLAGRPRPTPASPAGTESLSRMSTASVPGPFDPDVRLDSSPLPSPASRRARSLSRLRLPLLSRAARERPSGPAPEPDAQPAGLRPRRPGLGRGPGAGLDLGRMIHELSNLQRRLMPPQNGAPGAPRPTEASLVTSGTYIVVQGVFMARYTPPHTHSASSSTSPATASTTAPAETVPQPSASASGPTSAEASRDTRDRSSSPIADPHSPYNVSRAPGSSEAEPQEGSGPESGSGPAQPDRANATEQGALLTRMITVAASAVATNLLDPAQIMSRTMRGSIPAGYTRSPSTASPPTEAPSTPSTSTSTGQDAEPPRPAEGDTTAPAGDQPGPESSTAPAPAPAPVSASAPAPEAESGGDDPQRMDLPGMLRSALAGDTPGPGPAPHLHAESQPWPRSSAASGSTPTSPGGSEAAVHPGHDSPAGWTHASLEASLHRARAGRVDDGPGHTFDHWLHTLSTDLVAAIERAWAHRRAGHSPSTSTDPSTAAPAATEGESTAVPQPAPSDPSSGPSETTSATQVPDDVNRRRADDVTEDEIVFLRMFRFDPQPAPAPSSDGSASAQQGASSAPAASASEGTDEAQQAQTQTQGHAEGPGASDDLVPHLVVGIRSTHLPAESGASEGESAPVRYSILITGGYYEPSHPLRTQPLRGPGREMMYLMELLSTLQTFAGTFSSSVKKATQADIDASNTVVLEGREAIALAFEQGQIQGGEADHCCSVCYDEWADDCRARVLPCKHIFHTDCVDRWITQASNSCPLCRREAVPAASSPPPNFSMGAHAGPHPPSAER